MDCLDHSAGLDCFETQMRTRQASILPSSETWISAARESIISLIPWLDPMSQLLRILEMSRPRKFKLSTSSHTPRAYIPRGPRVARPPGKAFGKAVSLRTRAD